MSEKPDLLAADQGVARLLPCWISQGGRLTRAESRPGIESGPGVDELPGGGDGRGRANWPRACWRWCWAEASARRAWSGGRTHPVAASPAQLAQKDRWACFDHWVTAAAGSWPGSCYCCGPAGLATACARSRSGFAAGADVCGFDLPVVSRPPMATTPDQPDGCGLGIRTALVGGRRPVR